MKKRFRFGKAFPDELNKVASRFGHFRGQKSSSIDGTDFLFSSGSDNSPETPLSSVWRKLILPVFLLLLFAILLTRLFHLQIIEGNSNRDLADSNRIQVRVIHAPRGVIYDRNGKILAQNEPGFRLKETNGSSRAKYLTRDEYLKMEASGDPRIKDLEIDNIRTYSLSKKTAHVLGYLGEITEDELKDPQFLNYKSGDKIGRGGVEETYEKVLRGNDGGEIIEVDSTGKKLRVLRKTEAVPGQNLYLSIDAEMQSFAYDKLSETLKKTASCCGTLIAQNPQNGQVLSLISLPSFDPNNLSDALTAPNSPILNRAIGGTYPPGSTFKIASSLAGLSSKKITKDTLFEDTGVITLGSFTFSNWYFSQYGRREEGGVDIVRALKRSNDTFFYRLGEVVGEKILSETALKLNLGKKVGIDIPGEVAGLIPDSDWKIKNFGQVWYPGDTLHMAIGQGYVLATPLQINNLISLIASDGKQYPPHLALKITSPKNYLIKEFKFDPVVQSHFKQSDLDLVKLGLSQVPREGGTAWPFFPFPIRTAGKTGTAEFGDLKKTHAWYTSYAPLDKPEISITVLVEGGGEGSSIASPIAKELYRWYFSPDKKNLIRDIAPIASDSARTLGE